MNRELIGPANPPINQGVHHCSCRDHIEIIPILLSVIREKPHTSQLLIPFLRIGNIQALQIWVSYVPPHLFLTSQAVLSAAPPRSGKPIINGVTWGPEINGLEINGFHWGDFIPISEVYNFNKPYL